MRNIEWADVTWNPVSGCPHNCTWTAPDGKRVGCYARAMNDRFHWQEDFTVPELHAGKLDKPFRWRRPRRIFVCSMGDLFADAVPEMWIRNVLRVIERNPRHTFLLLTKNPKRLLEYEYPDNAQVGITLDANNKWLAYHGARVPWVSFEPLTENILAAGQTGALRSEWGIKWVVIGALSAGARKYQPQKEWVENILAAAEGLPVFMKDNLDCEALSIERRQEFPDG